MNQTRLFKLLYCLIFTIVFTLESLLPVMGKVHPAYAADALTAPRKEHYEIALSKSSADWSKVDKSLISAVKGVSDNTKDMAAAELDDWVDSLIKKVDDKFLNWYFSYGHQKAQEFGTPFAWLALKVDKATIKALTKKNEKDLKANEILQKRMIEDFNKKFQELVLDEEAEASLRKIMERVGRNYALLIGLKFAQIKDLYKISDREWERYSKTAGTVLIGTEKSYITFSPERPTIKTIDELLTIAIGSVVGKTALVLAGKTIALKGGGTVVATTSSVILLPILAGIVIWDVWDYNNMVKESRPELRQSIIDYLNQVKLSILDSPEHSIMAGIEKVETQIISWLKEQQIS